MSTRSYWQILAILQGQVTPSTEGSGHGRREPDWGDGLNMYNASEHPASFARELRKTLDAIPAYTWYAAPSGALTFVNERTADYLGLPKDHPLRSGIDMGADWDAHIPLLHPHDREGSRRSWADCLRTGSAGEMSFRVRNTQGEYRWFISRAEPLRAGDGTVLYWIGVNLDIEERKQTEFYLAEGQRLAQTGSWAFNRDGFEYWSSQLFEIHGLEPGASAPGIQEYLAFIHPEDRDFVVQEIRKMLSDPRGFDFTKRIVRPDGVIRHLRCVGSPRADGQGFVGTGMDVTEQEQLTKALRETQEELRRAQERLQQENAALREEIDQASMFEEIVGSSESVKKVLAQVSKVALSDSTVLILGETGTGKELIARALHKRSKRAARAFIGVNCGAIPASLIASELFGHEKGAFTGATQRRLGRFEAAHGGTIFLDEVGDLPADIQIALLRVLQEREIERVGGNKPIPVDVRVLAATHRDLDRLVSEGKFRQDLFYRLNVVPIPMPPLRERATDIPVLVEYFIARFGKKLGKQFRSIEKTTLAVLRAYEWPGNVRELQNVIERAVTLSDSDTFTVDEVWLKRGPVRLPQSSAALSGVLLAHEKVAIEAALAQSHGRISGPRGAAARLGVPTSTLDSKIKRLGIDKYRFKSRTS
jgi:formate hydrogenlyase transcriptional activator